MANIQTLLAKIMSAIYGEEVRGAIHDSIEAINDEVTEWTGLQDGTVTTAKLADGSVTRAKLNADVADAIGEVADIRIGADGKTYSSAGNAVRGQVSDLNNLVHEVVCENLMGNEANVLYPVEIAQGGYFTVSTSDGSIFATDSTLQVQLLNANKRQTDYFGLKNGATSRTIHTSTSQPTTYYLRFNEVPSVPLMVNYGQTPLQYQEYFPNLKSSTKQNTENIESLNEIVKDVPDYEKLVDVLVSQEFVKVTRPLLINGSLSTETGERDYTLSQVNSYVITPTLLHVAKGSKITKTNVTTMRVYEYSENDEYISYSTIGTGTTAYTFNSDKYVRLFFLTGNETNTKTVFDNVVFDLVLYDYEKPSVEATFMGLTGEKGTVKRDVYSGEACLIRFENSEVMAVDFHRDNDNNYQYYRDSLAYRGIRRIDYIVFSHYHDDHMGLFQKAIDYRYINIDGAIAYLPPLIGQAEITHRPSWGQTMYDRQQAIIQTLEEHNCTIIHPSEGDVLKIGDSIIEWYNTDHSIYLTSPYDSANYNDWSLCFNFRYGNTVVNYTGDLGPIGQQAMAGKMPKADILKAMHHGWDNGVNNVIPAFINNVSPNLIIACNGHEHLPSTGGNASIANRLSPIYSWAEANGVPAYPTNMNGNIDILINKYGYRLDGHYTRFIRNNKNWSYTDNSEHIET